MRHGVELRRGDKAVPVSWGGPAVAYVLCENVSAGQRITVTWPIVRFTQTYVPASVPDRKGMLTVHRIGNTVQSVEPRGRYLPMFETARPE